MKINTPSQSLEVVGYHGTRKTLVPSILKDGFLPSINEYDWLGDGIYFFQDAPNRANMWAINCFGDDASVIGAKIDLIDCIDLIDVGWAQFLADVYDSFLTKLKAERLPLPRQTTGAHRLDRSVLNYAVSVLNENKIKIRSIRAAFIEGSPIFPNSALFEKAHVQIVVRDKSVINEVWSENKILEVARDKT